MNTNPSLRERVGDLLSGGTNHPEAAARFRRQFKPLDGEQPDLEVKRMNRYWRTQLAQVDDATAMHARSFLADDLTPREWVTYFRREVMPVICNYELPK
jgi:hypothetical protein